MTKVFLMWSSTGHVFCSFLLFSHSYNKYSINFNYINWKSTNVVLGIWTQGRMMVGTDGSTELRRPPLWQKWFIQWMTLSLIFTARSFPFEIRLESDLPTDEERRKMIWTNGWEVVKSTRKKKIVTFQKRDVWLLKMKAQKSNKFGYCPPRTVSIVFPITAGPDT